MKIDVAKTTGKVLKDGCTFSEKIQKKKLI